MTKSKQPLRAVVLAAGQGTRMKSGMAKVLHRVLGKTILARVLDAVHGAGVEKAHLVLGHGKDQIEAHLQS
ncbi:MAG TPA: NTP transferase domain-containing protein [Candidatus Melainabacteria bacterium]|nr:NTP transferase domain-containing protein [Candidatus Melainabacteria bacterium]